VAESFAGEKNATAADSAYQAVVTRYPQSSRAATALYKRARARQTANRPTEARALYDELLRRFPKSDEAELAREAMRETRPPAARPRP
jgi:TolA-binding protein